MPRNKFFGRVVRVRVTPDPQNAPGEVVLVDGFDVDFDVEKTSEREPNKGKIVVYNLPEDVRSRLQLKDDSRVVLEAGYRLGTVATIFEGNSKHAPSAQTDVDWVTTIEALEASKAYRNSFAAKSFGPGTPFKTVVEYVVQTFEGFKITPAITRTLASVGDAFPNGITIDGPSAKVLSDVLRGAGLAFSIQNNEIQLLREGAANDQPAVSLDYSSGLVGTPQAGTKQDKGMVQFESFLDPRIFPGRRVTLLEPRSFKGTYVAQTVKHKGSTSGGDFITTTEAFVP